MMMMAAANHLHRIFYRRHGFRNPPLNPKVLVDDSFAIAADNNGGTAVSFVTSLLGPSARCCTTRCIADRVKRGNVVLPPEIKTIFCLHSSLIDDTEACLRKLLCTVNPKEYILATTNNGHLSNTVNGLPVITIDEAQAVFSPPSAAQIRYADNTTIDEIQKQKGLERKTLKNRKKSTKAAARQL